MVQVVLALDEPVELAIEVEMVEEPQLLLVATPSSSLLLAFIFKIGTGAETGTETI